MYLIDTSCWVHALRKRGNTDIRKRVQRLLLDDEAAWCEVVWVELWRGVTAKAEIQFLRELDNDLPKLPMNDAVWQLACELAQLCRLTGTPVPTTDLLIHACAAVHKIKLIHEDKHFDVLASLV